MDQALIIQRPLHAALVDLPLQQPADGFVRVEMLFSGVSAGTELSIYRGTNPRLHLDSEAPVDAWAPRVPPLRYPVRSPGYMQVGRIAQAPGRTELVGRVVALRCGHRSAAILDAREELTFLPATLPARCGVWVARMLPICANGLLHAAADEVGAAVANLGDGVVGRNVLVIGSGVVGILLACWARELGACQVVVADSSHPRLDVARDLGLGVVEEAEAESVSRAWRHGSRDSGADVVFQCRGRARSLALALRCVRPRHTVIDLAFYQDDAAGVRLGADFHHAGLSVRAAQIANRPRVVEDLWPDERLIAAGLDFLAAFHGPLTHALIDRSAPFARAPEVFAELNARRGARTVQTIFEF